MSAVMEEESPHEFDLFTRWMAAVTALSVLAEWDYGDMQDAREYAAFAHSQATKGAP